MLESLVETRSPRVHGWDGPSLRLPSAGQRPRHSTCLMVAENAADGAKIARRFTEAGWRSTTTSDLDRARWLASVRTFGLVVVAGSSSIWCTNALRLLRPLTPCPILTLSG